MDNFCAGNGTDGLTPASAHVIKNFSINAGGSGSCIKLQGVTRYVVIQNCTLFNSGSSISTGDAGIELIACQNINVTLCDIHDNLMGIYASFSSSIQVSYSNVHGDHADGLLLANTNGATVKNNQFVNSTGSGIHLEGATGNSFISNNASKNGLQGLDCDLYSTGNAFIMNTFSNNGKYEARDDSTSGNKFNDDVLGNMYGNYTARYPGARHDGILWNTPYVIYGNARSVDHHPLYNIMGTHQPFAITSDGQLDAFCSGNGTDDGTSWATAYKIKCYKISAGGGDYCIYMKDITRHLIIENCTFIAAYGYGQTSGGVKLISCSNIRVSNCSARYNGNGIITSTNSVNLVIDHNNITLNTCYGMDMQHTQNSSIFTNTFANNTYAGIIVEYTSNGNNFTNNIIKFNENIGIMTLLSNVSVISGNLIANNSLGILIDWSSEVNVTQNEIRGNSRYGIQTYDLTQDINITENVIKDSGTYGIYLQGGARTILKFNNMTGCGLMVDGTLRQITSYDIDMTNRVNGKFLYYYYNQTGLGSGAFSNAGEIILINCNGSTVKDLNCSHGSDAAILLYCHGNVIENASLSKFTDGGVLLRYSADCIINASKITDCAIGISIIASTQTKLRDNTFSTCGLWLGGTPGQCASQDIDTSNHVNGRLFRYFANKNGLVPGNFTNAGQILLVNCNASSASNQNVSHATCGIYVIYSNNNTFTNIDAQWSFEAGAYLSYSRGNNFVHCNFSWSGLYSYSTYSYIGSGVYADNSGGCAFENCSLDHEFYSGMFIYQAPNCYLMGNSISDGSFLGIYLGFSNAATMINNTLCNNYEALSLDHSCFDQISKNNFSGNNYTAIYISSCNNDTIYDNRICSNTYGFLLDSSSNNTIFHNTIANNSLFNAFYNPPTRPPTDRWYNGTEGNYWGDYKIQNPLAISLGRTWNTPYILGGYTTGVDLYPLCRPYAPNVKPAANFTADKTTALVHTAIQFTFTGFEGNSPVNFTWSFGDGSLNSTARNPVHIYNATGQYDVKLTVKDADFETSVVTKLNYITMFDVPSAPLSFTAIAGNSQVVLNWTAPANNGGLAITHYLIYRGMTAGGETLLATLGLVFTYTDSAVIGGTTYYYKVRAQNGMGFGVNSTEQNAMPVSVPTAPQAVTATGGINRVVLTWTAPAIGGGSPITHYLVYRGTKVGGEKLLATLNVVVTYTDASIVGGVTYYYKIQAQNGIGVGANSTERNAMPISASSAPQALTVTAGDAQVVLTWTAPANIGGSPIMSFNIYRGTTSGSETLLATVGYTFSYTDAGLNNGQIYYYKVSAVNGAGEGLISTEASVTPLLTTNPNNTNQEVIIVIGVSILALLALVIGVVAYMRHKKNASYVPVKKIRYGDQPLFDETAMNQGPSLSPVDQQLLDGSKFLDDRISEKRALLSRVLAPTTTEERSLEEVLKPSPEIEDVSFKKNKSTAPDEAIKHEVDQQTESEVSVFKKKERCIVCNTVLSGANFICPYCETKYCLRCALALSDMKENCWTCKNPINLDKG